MKPKLACADFTFPLLPHDEALQLIAMLDFDGVDIGLFEKRSHLWPSREFENVTRSARALSGKVADRGLIIADIFLQTDDPFKNSSLTLAVRNLGTNVKFQTVGYPLPAMVSAGLSYTLLNIDNHTFRVSVQADMPLLFSSDPDYPFYQDIEVGVGIEYAFFNLAFMRAGYTFNSVERNFAAGFGMNLSLGFTEYAVDYTFRPLPDYGFVHSFGVSISF